jgi:ParB-like chromosome segregation protein Spo0J
MGALFFVPVANGVVTRHDGCMSLERGTANLSDLKAAPYNPRKISPAALKGLQASIERFGVVQDIVVNRRSGFVVGGHQRVAALKVAGVKEVPVCWVDLDEPEEKALNVALNNPHISGEFDETLQELLAEIQDGIGPDLFQLVALDELLETTSIPDVKDTSSQLGDLEFRVVIEHLTEETQLALIDELESRGYRCKAMMS